MSHLQSEAMHPDITSEPALPPLQDSGFALCSCSACGKVMALRDARDYGLPEDMPRRVMRVVWWECRCGYREVVAKDILS